MLDSRLLTDFWKLPVDGDDLPSPRIETALAQVMLEARRRDAGAERFRRLLSAINAYFACVRLFDPRRIENVAHRFLLLCPRASSA